MAEKRVSVRLGAEGGRQVRAELEGLGEAGERGLRKVSAEAELANRRLEAFARRARIVAAGVAAAAGAMAAAMVRSGLQTIDSQAKLAQSLDTTVENVQVRRRECNLRKGASLIDGGTR